MIRSLTLNNFKCYRSSSVKFQDLTVFAGMNAAGKSTAIQSLCYLRQSTFGQKRPEEIPVNGRLVASGSVDDVVYCNVPRTSDVPISIELTGDEAEQTCRLTCRRYEKDHPAAKRALQVLEYDYQGEGNLLGKRFVYLGADRIVPSSGYRFPTGEEQIAFNMLGKHGEFTAWHLNRPDEERLTVRPILFPSDPKTDDGRPQLSQCVSQELSKLGRTVRVIPKMDDQLQYAGFRYSFLEGNDYGMEYRPENVGFGLTYALPVLTALLAVPRGSLVMIENPESHLHPKGQVAIGRFIARVAGAGVQVVVETHSDHVLNGVRLAVCDRELDANKVQLNFVANQGISEDIQVLTPHLLPDGMIDEWPEGFFDQYEISLGDLLRRGD